MCIRDRCNAIKITDELKRKSILCLLENVLIEVRYDEFEDQLNSFIECTDDAVREFRDYFVENYMETIPSWAYCYRLDPQVEGSLTLENFQRIFSTAKNIEGERGLISVTEALLTLDEYQRSKDKSRDARAVKIVELNGLISIIEENPVSYTHLTLPTIYSV